MHPKRVGILQSQQESNDLNPVRTTRADFESFRMGFGPEGLAKFFEGEDVGGFVIDTGRNQDHGVDRADQNIYLLRLNRPRNLA